MDAISQHQFCVRGNSNIAACIQHLRRDFRAVYFCRPLREKPEKSARTTAEIQNNGIRPDGLRYPLRVPLVNMVDEQILPVRTGRRKDCTKLPQRGSFLPTETISLKPALLVSQELPLPQS